MTERPDIPISPKKLVNVLENIGFSYEMFHHEPIFTVEEGLHLKAKIPGIHCRNLFLKDKKGKMFLITAANETKIDLKSLPERLDCGRLSFGSKDRLMEYLGIYPGAVTPFSAINDKNNDVAIILDQRMMEADIMNVHPLDNAITIGFAPNDLLKFFEYTGHNPQILAF